MSYLKAAHKIEEASFRKIQEIIDQEHPDIHFSDQQKGLYTYT